MATLWYGHFNSTPNDPRKMQAYEWARYIMSFITDGIRNGGTCLQVTADTGMQVKVDEGVANIQGYIMRVEADYEGRYHKVLVPESHPQYPRIDRLVLRLDLDPGGGMAGYIKPVVLQGTAAASPVAPTLTRNSKVWEMSLAQIRVAANTLSITQANITDERFNTALCGLINSVLGLDPSAWQAQYDTFMTALGADAKLMLEQFDGKFKTILADARTEFDQSQAARAAAWQAWFESIKVDLRRYAVFDFDNLAALPGTVRKTELSGANAVLSTIKLTASGLAVATRLQSRQTDGSITKVIKVFDCDGTSILKEATITTKLDAAGSVVETVTGYDNIGSQNEYAAGGGSGEAAEIGYVNADYPAITSAGQALDLVLSAVKALGWQEN